VSLQNLPDRMADPGSWCDTCGQRSHTGSRSPRWWWAISVSQERLGLGWKATQEVRIAVPDLRKFRNLHESVGIFSA